jgi:hypothetical protein
LPVTVAYSATNPERISQATSSGSSSMKLMAPSPPGGICAAMV